MKNITNLSGNYYNVQNLSFGGKKQQYQNYQMPYTAQDEFVPKKKKVKKLPIVLSVMTAAGILKGCSKIVSTDNYDNITNDVSISVNLDDFSSDYVDFYNSKENTASSELLDLLAQREEAKDGFSLLGIKAEKIDNKIREIVDQEGNEVNGYIDYNTTQGIISDCWLISALNNLSYTQKGAQYIHDAIKVNENGDINVHLKGPDLDYTVSKEELSDAKSIYSVYSAGDDDLLVFELAVEKFRQDLFDNKITVDKSLPDYCYATNRESVNVMDYGETRQAYWLLTGNPYSEIEYHDKNDVDKILNAYEADPKNSLLDVELEKDAKVVDVNGNEYTLNGIHGYSVKKIENGIITLVNAAYSNEEIMLKKEEIKNLPLIDLVFAKI